ncbi:AAA family ATPase [Herbidospora mongoliensis]|uniref:AAA family ATPase n=1 Tax=Herbidospora mongoliensis TaxID=688067 RepID=UPI000833A9BE|nr:AAA family ATPase [Herbidospora mongoliensis]
MHNEDPWTRVTSLRGFAADELISTLQKSIRRGMLENALLVAREMYESSPELEEQMWSRLLVISCEDTGTGTFSEPVVLDALYRMHQRISREFGDRWLFAAHAVRFLVSRTKDRTTDELGLWAAQALASGERLPEIPDWALDMHTRRGQEMGRDLSHFLHEGSKVENELPGRDTSYREQLLDVVAAGKWHG